MSLRSEAQGVLLKETMRRGPGRQMISLALMLVLASCAGPQPPARSVAVPPEPIVVPPVPWRDGDDSPVQRGHWRWIDAAREREIRARWTAPTGAAAQALVIVLPGLARGVEVPSVMMDSLAAAGFAVVSLGHPGNDDTVWQGPEARAADFKMAARRMYTTVEVAQRGADVRFVLEELERQPPSWLTSTAAQRAGVIGVDLGAQTAQWLVGEQMGRDGVPSSAARVRAAALLGPYVGFDGPSLHLRYQAISVPLLVVYGTSETDPYGLGMTAAQRRAMVTATTHARVTEVRTPSSVVSLLYPPAVVASSGEPASRSAPPSAGGMPRDPSSRGGKPGSGGPGPMKEAGNAGPDGIGPPSTGSQSNERASMIALIFSVRAFFEAELLSNVDAREWLEGRHPGPVQWATYPAGRSLPASNAPR